MLLMKYLKFFLILIFQFVLVELVIWFHTQETSWHIEELLPGDAISLWGTITTIVFLVFSVLGLWNIDQKIQELNEIKRVIGEKFSAIESKNREVSLEADKAQRNIIDEAKNQIKHILDQSSYRQNFYDILTRIANIPDPGRRILEYTLFLRTSSNIEGINYSYVYICRGDAYLSLSRREKALADYEMAASLDVKGIAPYIALGNYYVGVKEFQKSIDYFEKGLELDPQNDNLMMNIANSYSAMGDYAKADEYYDKALTYNPDLVEAYYNKARQVLDKQGNLWKENGMNYLNHCIQIMPYFMPANINKASLLREDNLNEEAAEVLSNVIGSVYHKDYVMSVLQRGIAYRMVGKLPLALNDFNTVLLYDPHNIQNLSNLALVNLQMHFFEDALFYAKLGLEEAAKQNLHTCDSDLNWVLNTLNNISGTSNSHV